MSLPRMLYRDHFQEADLISASSEDPDFPKENLQNELRTKTTRTTDVSDENYVFDLTVDRPLINTIVLVGGNLWSDMFDMRYQSNATDSWGSPTVNEEISRGTNLVSNGGFPSDTTGWTALNCTLASVAGGKAGNALEITRTGGTSQTARQTISGLKVGRRYLIAVYVKTGSSGDEAFNIYMARETTPFGIIKFLPGGGTSSSSWMRYSFVHTAQETSERLLVEKTTATAGTMLFDEIDIYLIPESDVIIHYLSSVAHLRYARLVLKNGISNGDGYLELGRVMGGLYSEPSKSFVHKGFSKGLNDLTTISKTPAGHAHSDIKPVYNDLALKFSLMTATDRDVVESMYRNNRLSKNIAVHVDPDDPDKAFYAKFMEKPKFAEDAETGSNLYNYDLKFTESV